MVTARTPSRLPWLTFDLYYWLIQYLGGTFCGTLDYKANLWNVRSVSHLGLETHHHCLEGRTEGAQAPPR